MARTLLERHYPIRLIEPRPMEVAELTKVHDDAYVRGVLSGTRNNGFGNRHRDVARSLPYTSGSMLAAVLAASPTLPAVSLSSGFHHACWDSGGGFCTFNGLVAAAASVLDSGQVRRVAILDCDAHYGNGTDNILQHLPRLAGHVLHVSMGKLALRRRRYLARLHEDLHEIGLFAPDVVIYQAGADPHIDDPLGGLLTTDEMKERDQLVFHFAKESRVPIAWNLAGGYQRGGGTGIDPVLTLHLNTFDAACEVFELPCPCVSRSSKAK